ncbi:extracellular solute-binding protein [Vibrio crassostreae]|uniref:extracellular solute-binding protein n=1 Tax=Vibrio crassostreae TaxID=246167 RepID=UPI00062FD602|nr:extracellular solute-binding protein [Vibrio crassostreae]TCO04812.1 putative spermidine/putrescine transport system substrate-binding protein [Vibrio crassostreae]CAK1927242.1 putative Spermidine/putrescine-binding periplasmic protein-like protein [Vibrio crassostreae]CAK1989428.1 putative Spermidine/putrescine-binding periplasmic protein-like protein [Vibrio crassostreae]CAK1991654.1 putative Spermidine/putrescine-binding periplasmic protein-like protein [Vibrio crassostreae]CAK2013156.1 
MRFITCFALTFSILLSAQSFAEELKIFTWEDYISDTLIEEFEERYGHTVSQVYFENEMLRDAVVYSGKALAYDLFIIDGQTIGELGRASILGDLSNTLKEGNSNFTEVSRRACGGIGIPYSNGTMGVAFRSSKVAEGITSWMDVFDYALKHPQTVVIPDDDVDTIAIALLALGFDPMTENEVELAQAYKLLMKVREQLLVIRAAIGYALDKKSGSKMEVAVIYSGEKEQIASYTEQDDWFYTIPQEGTLMWHECFSVHKDRPISKASIEFLNFINTPERSALNAEEMWFASSNRHVLGLASDDYLLDEELFPTGLDSGSSFTYKTLSKEASDLRSQILFVIHNQRYKTKK